MDSIRLIVQYGNAKYDLEISHKITRVIGNSGTGKTSLYNLVNPNIDKTVKMKIIGAKGYRAEALLKTATQSVAEYITKAKNLIIVCDENLKNEIQKHEVEEAIQNNKSCYFIIIGRHDCAGLNVDIDAVCKMECVNGINRLVKYLNEPIGVNRKIRFTHCMIEDTGKAKEWTSKLMGNIVKVESALSGKETFCSSVRNLIKRERASAVLMLFDRVSFGRCVTEYKSLINEYGHYLFVMNNYKSWEYLMLKTNMFKSKFIEYSIQTGLFEEKYYEQLLQKVSSSRLGTIKHDGGKLPLCYTEPCCPYTSNTDRECTFGIAPGTEKDKFVDLLRGTEFEDLLKISGRL